MPSTDPKTQLLRVVRGEADWRSLREFGFGIECELIEGGFRWNFPGPIPAEVELTPEDIVAAVFRLHGKDEQFREWTRFIMVASPLVGFDAIENWPHREEFINAMWDVGTWAEPVAAATLIRIAESIRDGTA